MVRNSSHLSVFVPLQLREALEHSAREHDRSLSAEIRVGLRQYIFPAGPLASHLLAGAARDELERS